MTLGLDTSMLVRLLTGAPAEAFEQARRRLLEAHRLGDRVVVSDIVVAEAWYALKLHYGFEPDAVRTSLSEMFRSGLVLPEPGSGAPAALLDGPGTAGFVDRLIHARHVASGATTLTFDLEMGRLPGVTVIA